MRRPNARGPNTTYIPHVHVGGLRWGITQILAFVLGVTQILAFALGVTQILAFPLGVMQT